MPRAPQLTSVRSTQRLLACVVACWILGGCLVYAQIIPALTGGPDAAFVRLDFTQMYLDQENKAAKDYERQKAHIKELIDSGVVSRLDVYAPNKAVDEFNLGSSLLKAQKAQEGIVHFQKAIKAYPKFVSGHIGLGLAYADQDDTEHARSEFEMAAQLDNKFPTSFLNLGLLAVSLMDFTAAQAQLEKAASLLPKDPKILSALAYAQNGNRQYLRVLETCQQVHATEHKGMANVHYVAASAAMALNDFERMQRELTFFVTEDPTNALAPLARQNLEVLARNKNPSVQLAGATGSLQATKLQTFPNSDRLKAELSALGDESTDPCVDCDTLAEANTTTVGGNSGIAARAPSGFSSHAGQFTFRKSVDEVALFFAVGNPGHMIDDLDPSDIQIRDNNKPPEKVLQFALQSKLPLRLALLIDTSGSVHDRFSFEKHAAAKFLQKVLSTPSDLGFVAGFSTEVIVTQDFTAATAELDKGIEKLANGGGTSLFDAVSFACWKLAAYPEHERAAKVVVVLSDGEDNSSHTSLRQSIRDAEATGVTIYTVSTSEETGPQKTDADKVLQELAGRSGGEAMFPVDMPTFNKSLAKLHDLIRSRYLVAYRPADFAPDGKYRTIQIIAERNGKRLPVHARQGYHARLASENIAHLDHTPLPAQEPAPQEPAPQASVASKAPLPASDSSQALLDISSTPPSAEIELDGSFIGNTPSSVSIPAGEHTFRITKRGFARWERKINVLAGKISVAAELEAEAKSAQLPQR